MSTAYADFLASKRRVVHDAGRPVELDEIHSSLFGFQRAITQWAVRKGRAAIFADTGLGKTRMQVEWARLTGERMLILAPLGVTQQTIREAASIGVEITYAHHQGEASDGITISNYERLDRFKPDAFGAVALDESSILKAFSGTTKKALVKSFADTPYRLCCTATPAPNDLEELCNHADFLGWMKPSEMRSTFFIADSRGQFMKYRIKKHARAAFFRWLASWAMAVHLPSDLGFPDDGFALPPLLVVPQIVPAPQMESDRLFITDLYGVREQSSVRRATLDARVQRTVEIIYESWRVPNINGNGMPLTGNESGLSSETTDLLTVTRSEPSGVSTTKSTRNGSRPKSEHTESAILSNGRSGTSASNMESPLLTPGLCSLLNQDSAPSVVEPFPLLGPNPGSTLTTITSPGSSEDCSAPDATSDLDTSRTTQRAYVPRRNISNLEPWIVWCGLNDEQRAIEERLGDLCFSVYGSLPADEKESLIMRWLDGERPVLLSKVSICGFGMNFQRCARMAFCGLGYSYEQYYQAIRRCHRFGQTRQVVAHVVVSDVERSIYDTVVAKERQAAELTGGLLAEMRDYERAELFAGTSMGDDYEPHRELSVPDWMGTRV